MHPFVEQSLDLLACRYRVRFGRLVHAHEKRKVVVEARSRDVALHPDLDASDVLEQDLSAGRGIASHHDVLELLRSLEAPFHVELVGQILGREFISYAARSSLDVLLLDGLLDIEDGQPQAAQPHRVEPDAHRVLAVRAFHLGDTVYALHRIGYLLLHEVAQIRKAHFAAVRDEDVHRHAVLGALLHLYAVLHHLGRQLWLGALDGVLEVDEVYVRIRSRLERHIAAVRTRLVADGVEIEQIVHRVYLVFERRCDRIGHDLRAGSGVLGRHSDHGRHDLRVFSDGNRTAAQVSAERDYDRHHEGQPRMLYEDTREHLLHFPAKGSITVPLLTLCTPSATIRSPGLTPLTTVCMP